MFLWVTDFYSLEKIISVSPQIVLLYLKKKQLQRERGGGWMDGEWGHRGIFLQGGMRVAGLDMDCCRSLHPEASAAWGTLECECQEGQVWLAVLNANSFQFKKTTRGSHFRILVFDRQLGTSTWTGGMNHAFLTTFGSMAAPYVALIKVRNSFMYIIFIWTTTVS